jgi:prepilin-type N-terminal cleavage/methylation domain-containing protein/prepilin-type processing-associated H-X9-DG protein
MEASTQSSTFNIHRGEALALNVECCDRGFTLVELMVVITIVVILLALLTPAMDRAMDAAVIARCMANQRGVAQALRFYAGDHRGYIMPISNAAGDYWFHKLAKYIGHGSGPRGFYEGQVKMLDCPEAAVNAGDSLDGYGPYGGAHQGWQWASTFGASGMNLWLIYDYAQYRNANYWSHDNFYTRYINAPGETPLLADSNWVGSWPGSQQPEQPEAQDLRPGPDETDTGYRDHAHGFFMGRFAIARHGLSVNVGFVDGSARNVRLGGLWALRWHKNFQPTHEFEDTYK